MSDSNSATDERARKIYFWSVGVVIAIVLAFVVGANLLPASSEEPEVTPLSEEELDSAKDFAASFLTTAGNFGFNKDIDPNVLTMVSRQVANNNGDYNNYVFGVSRAETYKNLSTTFDSESRFDEGPLTLEKMRGYSPDWSGQLANYQLGNIQITPGELTLIGKKRVQLLTVSFTSEVTLYVNESDFGSSSTTWNKYSGEFFETISLEVAEQQDGSWLLFSIESPSDAPYVLVTWLSPDWKTAAPSRTTLIKESR